LHSIEPDLRLSPALRVSFYVIDQMSKVCLV
jgi:hypothetical protein